MLLNPYSNGKNIEYGSLIRQIRKSRGLSQTELGELVGLNANRIQMYENNARSPKLDMLNKLFDALNVDVQIKCEFIVKDKNQ